MQRNQNLLLSNAKRMARWTPSLAALRSTHVGDCDGGSGFVWADQTQFCFTSYQALFLSLDSSSLTVFWFTTIHTKPTLRLFFLWTISTNTLCVREGRTTIAHTIVLLPWRRRLAYGLQLMVFSFSLFIKRIPITLCKDTTQHLSVSSTTRPCHQPCLPLCFILSNKHKQRLSACGWLAKERLVCICITYIYTC